MASPIHAMCLSVVVGALSAGLMSFAAPAKAQEALSGQVASQQEGAMEGVLVSAKRSGSTMTVTVVSDAQGRYSFPRERLDPGNYSMRIRAVGYELPNAGAAQVEVTA